MEQWEIDLRAKLQKELPDGLYEIGFPGSKIQGWTGKGGKIDMEVALHKELRKMSENFKSENTPKTEFKLKDKYSNITEEKLKELIRDAMYGKSK